MRRQRAFCIGSCRRLVGRVPWAGLAVFAGGQEVHPPPATQIWPKGPHCLGKQSRKPLGVAGRHSLWPKKQLQPSKPSIRSPRPLRTDNGAVLRRHCTSNASLPRQVDSAGGHSSVGSMPNRSGASWLVQEAQLWSVVRIPRPGLGGIKSSQGEGANTLLASPGHLVFHASGMHVPMASRSSTMRH